MNIYAIFIEGRATMWVRAHYSFDAVNAVEKRFNVRVSAWDVETRLPANATVLNSWEL